MNRICTDSMVSPKVSLTTFQGDIMSSKLSSRRFSRHTLASLSTLLLTMPGISLAIEVVPIGGWYAGYWYSDLGGGSLSCGSNSSGDANSITSDTDSYTRDFDYSPTLFEPYTPDFDYSPTLFEPYTRDFDYSPSYDFDYSPSYDFDNSYSWGDSGGMFVGDPINSLTSNIVESVQDYRGRGPFPLALTRTYNSLPIPVSGVLNSLGGNWRSNFDAAIVTAGNDVYAYRADGGAAKFTLVNGVYQSVGADVLSTLQVVTSNGHTTGWVYTTPGHIVETYDANGHLIKITNRNGLTQTLDYDANGLLQSVVDPAGRRLTFIYDGARRLINVIGPDGGKVLYAYDGNNNLASVTYPDGATWRYRYENSSFASLLTSKVDTLGNVVSIWSYDSQGRAIANKMANGIQAVSVNYNQNTSDVTDVRGVVRSRQFQRIGSTNKITSLNVSCPTCEPNLIQTITYDNQGFVASSTDFGGRVVRYTRDARGLVLTRIVAAGTPLAQTTTYTWHPVYRAPTSIVFPGGRTLRFEYDDRGNTTRRIETVGKISRAWSFEYAPSGQLVKVQGPRPDMPNVTHISYDEQGNRTSLTNALGQTTRFAYDVSGHLTGVTDPNNRTTSYAYDANGRRLSVTVGALVTRYEYNTNGLLSAISLPNGNKYTYAYDAALRLIAVTDRRGNRLAMQRDLAGAVTGIGRFDATGNLVRSRSYAFDQRGRLAQQSGNNGQQVTYSYDRNNNLLKASDALQRSSQVHYDVLNRVDQITDPLGGVTRYSYDTFGALVAVTSPRNLTTRYQRDGFERVVQQTSPDTGDTRYQYDLADNLIAKTDAKNQTTRIRYDALNRPIAISYADKKQLTVFAYDKGSNGVGRLTSIGNKDSRLDYEYDANGRITLQQQSVGHLDVAVRYRYTAIGQLTSMVYPSGTKLQVAYGDDGKVSALSVNDKVLLDKVQYQADGKIGQWTWGNGKIATRTFDSDGRLKGYSKAKSTASISYDTVDRIINLADSGSPRLAQTFGYDNNDQLNNYLAYASNWRFQYDADGNRTAANSASSSTLYGYAGNSNWLLNLSGGTRAKFEYDARGNIMADGVNRYTYDSRNRLTEVSNHGGHTRYIYDPLGQRVAKLGQNGERCGADDDYDRDQERGRKAGHDCERYDDHFGDATYFAYDTAGHLLGEYDSHHNRSIEYVWLGGVPMAIVSKTGHGQATVSLIHTDHLGTPRQVSDSSSGALVWEWFGEPFGTTPPDEDPSHTGRRFTLNLRFPGQYFDKESGLFHNGARDYNPKLGRYIESDPIGLGGGINTYAYVTGNPMSYIDPTGLWSITGGGYLGVGGEITFGNHNGNGFFTGRVGFGWGGGISFDPNGGIPGPAIQDPARGGGVLSESAQVAFNAGPVSAAVELGFARNYSNGQSSFYGNPSGGLTSALKGFRVVGSVGAQCTVYSGRQ